jgi:hypothetical protein
VAASMSYRKDEIPVLNAVQSLYGRKFEKALVAGRYFDFADDYYLVEHTEDDTKGICDATERFQAAQAVGDLRRRVLFAVKSAIGKKRMARLEAVGVEVRDCSELDQWK